MRWCKDSALACLFPARRKLGNWKIPKKAKKLCTEQTTNLRLEIVASSAVANLIICYTQVYPIYTFGIIPTHKI